MSRITYFLSHPIQYFSPLFRSLSKEVKTDVVYYSDASVKGYLDSGFGQIVQWDIPLLDGYSFSFLVNRSWRKSLDNRILDVINPGIFRRLLGTRSRVLIVHGWSYSTDLIVIFLGKLIGKEIWLRCENPYNQEMMKSTTALMLKKFFLKKFLFKYFIDKGLYIGSQSRLFFRHYGVPDDRLVFTPYSVDNEFFSGQSLTYSRDIEQLKRSLGFSEQERIVLFSGKFIEKKRPLDLLEAFYKLNDPGSTLVMVGDGHLRGKMENYIVESGLKNVRLTGFVNQSDISMYYAVCDVFVMCSGLGETWGLSVNEAMNFGKPVLVSSTCGSSFDLVKDGVNGFVFREGDTEELARRLKQLLDNPALRRSAGESSRQIIAGYSIEKSVENIKLALKD